MTKRVMADGAAAGCNVAVLQSSDIGFKVYERLGYRTVIEYPGYAEPSLLPAVEQAADPTSRHRSEQLVAAH
jgi:hypothetical protein